MPTIVLVTLLMMAPMALLLLRMTLAAPLLLMMAKRESLSEAQQLALPGSARTKTENPVLETTQKFIASSGDG